VKCGNCGNDLMLGIVPQGPARLLRLLPLAPYRCVRCGKSNWRLSASYGALGSRLALCLAGLAALVLAYWLGATFGLPGAEPPGHEVALAGREPVRFQAPTPPPPAPAPEPAPQRAEPAAQQKTPAPVPAPEAPAPQGQQRPEAPRAAPAPPTPPGTAAGTPPQGQPAAPPSTAPARPGPASAPPRAQAAPAAQPLALRDMSVRMAEGGAVLVTARASAALGEPEAFVLDGPPRFVVDIPGRWTQDSARSVTKDAGALRGVRTGLRDGALRLVLDLKRRPARVPAIVLRGDTLTITLP
jgi:hypothetical protein